jgi:hypothetical protein
LTPRSPGILFGAAAFVLAAGFAAVEDWSLPEFCWSAWLAGLLYAWLGILAVMIRIGLLARAGRDAWTSRLPVLERLPPAAFPPAAALIAVAGGLIAFHLCNFLFAFYGILLSFFAEMEPHVFFGRNGFINSDFYSPVAYLLTRYWPMALGVALAHGDALLRTPGRNRIADPAMREILRTHVMVVTVPFLSLFAWFIFGDRYHTPTILLLMALLFLLPRKPASGSSTPTSPAQAD